MLLLVFIVSNKSILINTLKICIIDIINKIVVNCMSRDQVKGILLYGKIYVIKNSIHFQW